MVFRRATPCPSCPPIMRLPGLLAVLGWNGGGPAPTLPDTAALTGRRVMKPESQSRGGRADTELRRCRHDRRGTVAVMTAVIIIPLIMAMGIGIEVTNWTMVRLRLQRTVDVAALSGAADYALNNDAKKAAYVAAGVAELNGAEGTGNAAGQSWNAVTQTLTDNRISIQVGPGVQNSNKTGVMVTVTQAIPLAFTRVMSSLGMVTITASGWAEAVGYSQPCILALGPSPTGVVAGGTPQVSAPNCTVRSNKLILSAGSAAMAAAAFYANGSIIGGGITGTQYPNSGTIPDPYGNDIAIKNAFAFLAASGFGTSLAQNSNPVAGTVYSDWTIQGTASVSLAPGTYYVNGPITLSGQASLAGVGVTIVSSGAISISGGTKVNLLAALNGGTGGAIPGVVIASSTIQPSQITGNSPPLLTGIVYFPNADLTFSGTSQTGTQGCLEIVANSVTFAGTTSLAVGSNCSAYGALAFSSTTSNPAALVQ